MYKTRKWTVALVALSLLVSCFPVYANEPASSGNTTTETIVRHDLSTGNTEEIEIDIDANIAGTIGDIVNNPSITPYFLEPIDYPNEFPFNGIGFIRTTRSTGNVTTASGIVVGRNLVLTSAHVIHDYQSGYGDARQIDFYAGYDYNGNSLDSSSATAYYVSTGWNESEDINYDWALIELSDSMNSSLVSVLPCQVKSMLNKTVMTVGYPSTFHGGSGASQGISEGEVFYQTSLYMRSRAEGDYGSSGGAFLDINDGNFVVVGVTSGGNALGQLGGPRINSTIVNLINSYNSSH